MLGYVLSKSESWECRPSDIEREGNLGKDARRRLMKEAEVAGYFTYHTARGPQGRIEAWYDVHEEPVPVEERTKSWMTGSPKQSPDTENPQAANDSPGAENPQADMAENPPSPGAGLPAADEPAAGQPGAGQPAAGKPGALINKEYEKTEYEKTEYEKTEGERAREVGQPEFAPEVEAERTKSSEPRNGAYEIYRRFFDRVLPIFTQEQLSQVEDMAIWEQTLRDWLTNDYKSQNVAGMIRQYKQDVLYAAKSSRGGTGSAKTRNDSGKVGTVANSGVTSRFKGGREL